MVRILLCGLLALAACVPSGHARMVRRDLTGGTLALVGQRDLAMAEARKEMRSTCGGDDFEILGEEEAVVGQQGSVNFHETSVYARTSDVTE